MKELQTVLSTWGRSTRYEKYFLYYGQHIENKFFLQFEKKKWTSVTQKHDLNFYHWRIIQNCINKNMYLDVWKVYKTFSAKTDQTGLDVNLVYKVLSTNFMLLTSILTSKDHHGIYRHCLSTVLVMNIIPFLDTAWSPPKGWETTCHHSTQHRSHSDTLV